MILSFGDALDCSSSKSGISSYVGKHRNKRGKDSRRPLYLSRGVREKYGGDESEECELDCYAELDYTLELDGWDTGGTFDNL